MHALLLPDILIINLEFVHYGSVVIEGFTWKVHIGNATVGQLIFHNHLFYGCPGPGNILPVLMCQHDL